MAAGPYEVTVTKPCTVTINSKVGVSYTGDQDGDLSESSFTATADGSTIKLESRTPVQKFDDGDVVDPEGCGTLND